MSNPPKFYTVDEIAETLRMSRFCVYDLIHTARLKSVKVGGKWLVSQENLDEFLGSSPTNKLPDLENE